MRNRINPTYVVAIIVLAIILGVEWCFLIGALSNYNTTQSGGASTS